MLGGNCVSCLGTTAGLDGGGELGAVWLDAHADFDTPEDNLSGFTDVMGLAILTGSGWRALRETIPGFSVVDEAHVALVGTRDLEPYQRERIARSRLLVAPGAEPPGAILEALRERVRRVYLHVDLDVLDTSVGRANPYAAPGGPDLDAVLATIGATFDRFDVGAAALTAYDPRVDEGGAIAAAARAITRRIAEAALAAFRPPCTCGTSRSSSRSSTGATSIYSSPSPTRWPPGHSPRARWPIRCGRSSSATTRCAFSWPPSRTSISVTGVLSRTSPPSRRISSAIVSHIWPGP